MKFTISPLYIWILYKWVNVYLANSEDPEEMLGAQWLSGRVLDLRLRVWASPVSLCCVLEQVTFILA